MSSISQAIIRKLLGPRRGFPPGDEKSFLVGNSPVSVGRFTYGYTHMEVVEWGDGTRLRIGAFCSLAPGLTIRLGGNHRVDWITTYPFGHAYQRELVGPGIVGHPATKGDVVIGNDVWIAADVTILSGVRIGDGAVIGANSVVTKDVPAYEIWAGNPARMRARRFSPDIAAALQELRWWEWDLDVIRDIAPTLSQAPTLELIEDLRRRYGAGAGQSPSSQT